MFIIAALFAVRQYNIHNAPKIQKINYYGTTSIEEYLKRNMHDPSSLESEINTLPLLLYTIVNEELFPNKREYYLMRGTHRGKNAFGATVLDESVFYVTEDGQCIYSQESKKLFSEERAWIFDASMKAVSQL